MLAIANKNLEIFKTNFWKKLPTFLWKICSVVNDSYYSVIVIIIIIIIITTTTTTTTITIIIVIIIITASFPKNWSSATVVHTLCCSYSLLFILFTFSWKCGKCGSIYVGKKKCRGNLPVSKFASATPQHYFFWNQWDFMLRLSGFTLTALTNWGKIFSLQKTLTEKSPITDFCFNLTFIIKYYFDCMRSCNLGCSCYGYGLPAIKDCRYL